MSAFALCDLVNDLTTANPCHWSVPEWLKTPRTLDLVGLGTMVDANQVQLPKFFVWTHPIFVFLRMAHMWFYSVRCIFQKAHNCICHFRRIGSCFATLRIFSIRRFSLFQILKNFAHGYFNWKRAFSARAGKYRLSVLAEIANSTSWFRK